jgi:2-polyprenyl-3-methyl-5-hydroxy-6-metoxy-1,4-benzoquinol methylase
MEPKPEVCPGCGLRELVPEGPLPASPGFAGVELPAPLPGGFQYRCPSCLLRFRHPRLSKSETDALYARGGTAEWEATEQLREDWALVGQLVATEFSDRPFRILDFGCYDGGFLRTLGANAGKHGIEINVEGVKAARKAGIEVIGQDILDVPKENRAFDVAVSMDVMEHVESPLQLLMSMASSVRAGGIVVISTGNADHWTWRMMKSKYWYSAFAEHISFISPSWCRKNAGACRLRVESISIFSHQSRASWKRKLIELAYNASYAALPAMWRWLRRQGFGGHDIRSKPALADYPPSWVSARDHFVCTFRKLDA